MLKFALILKVDGDSSSPKGVVANIGWKASSFASSLYHSKGFSSKEEQERINQRLIARVNKLEKRARKKREWEGKKVLGAEQLINQTLNVTYLSKRSGKRMWCLCEDRDFRIRFIQFLKTLISKARAVRARWALGDYSEPYPLGLYPPTMPKLAEPLTIW